MDNSPKLFEKINSDQKKVRTFCILGHIDSGKTSVSDYLIGILSNSLCGTMKYMDTRLDEQEKQITMKTSCFTFFHQNYCYHLLDTPGHLDFFHEIKQGILLSEGIILLISTVKGIESQTLQIIKSIRSYLNRKRVILILNKIDRLIVEKELDQLELYLYLKEIIHQINQLLDTPNYFDPVKENVIFASALDGWGFRLSDLVRIYSNRFPFLANPPEGSGCLKLSPSCFWGTYLIKKKKIVESEEIDKRIIFCSLVLNDLTMLYNLFYLDPDPRISEKKVMKMKKRVLKQIGITGKQVSRLATPKRTNRRNALKKIFQRLYPLKEILLDSIIRVFPPVLTYLDQGLHYVLSNHKFFRPEVINEFKSGSKSSITLVYCIKFLLVPKTVRTTFTNPNINQSEEIDGEDEDDEDKEAATKKKKDSVFDRFQFVGLCKIFSGVLRRGDICHLIDTSTGQPIEVEARDLYLLQGNEVHPISEVHAGNIFGIGACIDRLETFKRGFLVHSKKRDLYIHTPFPKVRSFFRARLSNPILSYSVEARSHDDFYLLLRSLKMLNKMDAAVQIFVRPTGENIIRTEGEVHMDRCLYDLRHHFFKNEEGRFVVSEDPMVQFRETIVKPQIVTLEDVRHLDDEAEDLLRTEDLELRKKKPKKGWDDDDQEHLTPVGPPEDDPQDDDEEKDQKSDDKNKEEDEKEEKKEDDDDKNIVSKDDEKVSEDDQQKDPEEQKQEEESKKGRKKDDDDDGDFNTSDEEEEEEGEGEEEEPEEELDLEDDGETTIVQQQTIEERSADSPAPDPSIKEEDQKNPNVFLKKKQDGERMELEKKSGLEVRYSKCFKRVYVIENLYHQVKLKLKIYPPIELEELEDVIIEDDEEVELKEEETEGEDDDDNKTQQEQKKKKKKKKKRRKKRKLRLRNSSEWKLYFRRLRRELFIKYLIEKKIRELKKQKQRDNIEDGDDEEDSNVIDENINEDELMKNWEDQVWHIDTKNKNVLLNHVEWYLDSSKFVNYFKKEEEKKKKTENVAENVVDEEEQPKKTKEEEEEDGEGFDERIDMLKRNDDKFIAGFLVGISKGTICGETMTNCIFSIEDIIFEKLEVDEKEETENESTETEEESGGEEEKEEKESTSSILSSFHEIEIINLVKDGILKCFSGCKRKLLEPIYKCFISVHSKQLKHCMKVIKKRRGKVINSYQNFKNNQWNIEALIPVVESLGMINEMRDETSGLATIFMKFFKYSLIENEEIEDELILRIQKKKGMCVEKLVEDAEKQRTISRKK